MNSTLNVADMMPDDGEFVLDVRPRTTVGSATNEQRTMTRDEQDDYLVAHFGVDQTQGQICAATGIPNGSITLRIKSLKEATRIPADRQSLGRQGWRDNPEQPEQKAIEPKHECPPHHRICGDNDIIAMWPDYYETHGRPAPGVELQVCKYCSDVKAVNVYKPSSLDAQTERNIAGMRESRAIAGAREREYAPVAAKRNHYNPYLGIRPRGEVAVAVDSSPVEYDQGAGDEHHDSPEQLHHVDIPEELGPSLLEAEDDKQSPAGVMIIPTQDNLFGPEVRLNVDEEGNVSPMVSSTVVQLIAELEGETSLADIAEETATPLTPYGMALQELSEAKAQLALLRSDLARTEGELRSAYDYSRQLTARLEQTDTELHRARMQLLLPDLVKRSEELRQALADISGEIEEIEAELG